MSLDSYIKEMANAIAAEKPYVLQELLTINPGHERGTQRANFGDPSDIDLYMLPEKFHAVVRAYLRAMRSIYIASDLRASFVDLKELLVCLNRAAESQTNWICPALINCSDELISVYQVRARQFPEPSPSPGDLGDLSDLGDETAKKDSPLEMVADIINRSFKICLTDKNLDAATSKKLSIPFFLAALLKIYFKLGKLELAKSVEKALAATRHTPPNRHNTPAFARKHAVTYLYYSALLSLNDSDFEAAERKLCTTLDFFACYTRLRAVAKPSEKVLVLLVPLKMANSCRTLSASKWASYPALRYIYRDRLFAALNTGHLRAFDHWTFRFLRVFHHRYLYILVLHLRSLCILRLFQRTHRLYAELALELPHIVPFSAFQLALKFSRSYDDKLHETAAADPESRLPDVDYGEVECLLANFIQRRQIKGYLLHSNKCIVLLKTAPFLAA